MRRSGFWASSSSGSGRSRTSDGPSFPSCFSPSVCRNGAWPRGSTLTCGHVGNARSRTSVPDVCTMTRPDSPSCYAATRLWIWGNILRGTTNWRTTRSRTRPSGFDRGRGSASRTRYRFEHTWTFSNRRWSTGCCNWASSARCPPPAFRDCRGKGRAEERSARWNRSRLPRSSDCSTRWGGSVRRSWTRCPFARTPPSRSELSSSEYRRLSCWTCFAERAGCRLYPWLYLETVVTQRSIIDMSNYPDFIRDGEEKGKLPGNLRELVCNNFLGELPSCRLFAAGEDSLLAGLDLTGWITPWVVPPCIRASCGSELSWTEHLLLSFLHRWLMLLFHKFRSVMQERKKNSAWLPVAGCAAISWGGYIEEAR